MILAIDTATDICSVVFKDKNGEIFEKRSTTKSSHSENLFLFIQALMDEHNFAISELATILVSEGPGSYTGLRIAASGVKGILFGKDIPLIGVNTLASFAISSIGSGLAKSSTEQRIHSIIDARRKHLYYQQFVFDGLLVAKTEVAATPIKQVEQSIDTGDIIVGTGLERIDNAVKEKVKMAGNEAISAQSLITLFEMGANDFVTTVVPEEFEPKYYTSSQVSS